jgi:hypothetical protein
LNDTVVLTTDTAGDYVASFTAGAGLTGDASGEGSTPTLAVGAGTGITVNANDVAINQGFTPTWTGAHIFQSDIDFIFGNGENFVLTSNSNSDSSIAAWTVIQDDDADATDDLFALDLTLQNDSGDAGDTVTGIRLQNANTAANQVTDSFITLDNLETSAAVTAGLLFGNTGTITTALDASASNIGTALALGSNDVTVGGVTIDSTEFSLLNGRSGTLVDSANVATFATTGVTAGSGLTGGGTVGALTLNIGSSSTITVNADDIAVTADSIGDTQLAFNTG